MKPRSARISLNDVEPLLLEKPATSAPFNPGRLKSNTAEANAANAAIKCLIVKVTVTWQAALGIVEVSTLSDSR
jgi:hypothetical protein